ncbi:MAG: peptidoglycan DD-metalloendopeptidase family protein [Sediminispirochaetaceae bacterium]
MASAAAVLIVLTGLLGIAGLAGCRQEEVAEPFEPTESHSAYREGLEKMDLADTEMGRRWITAAEEVFGEALEIELPYKENLFFDPADPKAQGYLFSAERGRSVSITIERRDEADLRLFADLFRLESEGLEPEEQVASYSREEGSLVFEPRRDNRYTLRIQPELLRGGMFTVTIMEDPTLASPVEGKTMTDIQSFFGDPRDGGRRRHEGVDVFAPRGTNVLAVTDGVVRRVGTRDLGGNIVLLWDEKRNLSYYYAHLDAQYVVNGQRVLVGDPLGAVGNTGNAVTTPPHLHFGVYEPRFRAVDPWNFIKPGRGAPDEPMELDIDAGSFVRTVAGIPSDGPLEAVEPGTILRVRGVGPETVRVVLPHGSGTFEVGYSDIEPAGAVDSTVEAGDETNAGNETYAGDETNAGVNPDDPYLYSKPEPQGERIAQLQPSEAVSLLGINGSFLYVETPAGTRGWMRRM